MAANFAKAAAVGALAMNGGGNTNNNILPDCPNPELAHYHREEVCLNGLKPTRPSLGSHDRNEIYESLKASGLGATLVPNQQTVVCPMEVQRLENPTAVRGLDTTWIVENTATTPVVISWLEDGIEKSPFKPDTKPMEDPLAIVQPGDWISVPTYESFVYHVREIEDDGNPGKVVLQHRAGLIPIGNPNQYDCDASLPDVEPVNPTTAERKIEFGRTPTPESRPCNTVDISFRNQVGCPLHVYWANRLDDVPQDGFSCGEKFKFHLGTKPAPQDFMLDWDSSTKFEGSYVGHTFVARLASDPSVVIDSYTVEPTRVIDCPNLKEQVAISSKDDQAEAEVRVDGTIENRNEETVDSTLHLQEAVTAGLGGVSSTSG
eukprot:scaffold22589_cov138-Cylindrotheca_fusiformis.AAC.50